MALFPTFSYDERTKSCYSWRMRTCACSALLVFVSGRLCRLKQWIPFWVLSRLNVRYSAALCLLAAFYPLSFAPFLFHLLAFSFVLCLGSAAHWTMRCWWYRRPSHGRCGPQPQFLLPPAKHGMEFNFRSFWRPLKQRTYERYFTLVAFSAYLKLTTATSTNQTIRFIIINQPA